MKTESKNLLAVHVSLIIGINVGNWNSDNRSLRMDSYNLSARFLQRCKCKKAPLNTLEHIKAIYMHNCSSVWCIPYVCKYYCLKMSLSSEWLPPFHQTDLRSREFVTRNTMDPCVSLSLWRPRSISFIVWCSVWPSRGRGKVT